MTSKPLPPVRKRLFSLMGATVADQARHGLWTYAAERPEPVPALWKPGQKVKADCSKGVQFLCCWAKAPDPMRSSFGPYGNSQTIWAMLPAVDRHALQVGDLVTFGADGAEHAAMVYQADADPVLWSFGHQGAPNFYRLSYDHREAQYRQLMPTAAASQHVQTAGDKLRAQTGFYAWVAWRLGEGDWHSRGTANAIVRPDVPKVIPRDWWARNAAFIANRNQPNPPKGMRD
jgi:hypothetical protein